MPESGKKGGIELTLQQCFLRNVEKNLRDIWKLCVNCLEITVNLVPFILVSFNTAWFRSETVIYNRQQILLSVSKKENNDSQMEDNSYEYQYQ